MKSSYQDHYNPELKPDPRNLTPAGSVTRGGRMISQRETYGYYYKASSPRPVTLNSKSVPETPTAIFPLERSCTTAELYRKSLNDNMWPYVEHKSSCFYVTKPDY